MATRPRPDPEPNPEPPARPSTLEYNMVEVYLSASTTDLMAALNAAGKQGWRLVTADVHGGFRRYLMMRETP
jgi:hypothetical protein